MTRTTQLTLLISMISMVMVGMSLTSCVPVAPLPMATTEGTAAVHVSGTAEAAAVQTIEAALAEQATSVDVDATAQALVHLYIAQTVEAMPTVARTLTATLRPPTSTPATTLVDTPMPTDTPAPTTLPLAGEITPAAQVTTRGGNTGLAVCLKQAEGNPRQGVYAKVFSQIEDVSGNPTYDELIDGGRTDQTGCVVFSLNPGVYVAWMDSFEGYHWGNMAGFPGMSEVEVKDGQLTVLTIASGRLAVGFTYADGKPVEGQYVKVYTQQLDLDGNPVVGYNVDGGRTDNRGAVAFELMPGAYTVSSDFLGYNWGSATDVEGEANVIISAGRTTDIQRRLGCLVAEARDPSGNAAEDVYVNLHTQTSDISGNPALANGIGGGRTDNTGRIWWNLTQGTYAIQTGDRVQHNIPIEWCKTTYVDGTKVLRME